jgi:hypothetical protein
MRYDQKFHFDESLKVLVGFKDESPWRIAFYFYRYFRGVCLYRHRISSAAD